MAGSTTVSTLEAIQLLLLGDDAHIDALSSHNCTYPGRIGTDITCCDRCCRCHFCDDKGELPEDEQPGSRRRAQQKAAEEQRAAAAGEEPLPQYEAVQPQKQEVMTVPVPVDPPATSLTGAQTEGASASQHGETAIGAHSPAAPTTTI